MIAFFELAHTSTVASAALDLDLDEAQEDADTDTDLFHYTAPAGGNASLRGALGFVAPYAANRTSHLQWPPQYTEETPFDHGKFFQILRMASRVWSGDSSGEDAYERMIPELPGDVDYEANVINLLWPKRRG